MGISCKLNSKQSKKNSSFIKDTASKEIKISPENYSITKRNIIALAKNGGTINETDKLRASFINIVYDSIIPYWIGTKWNFNGITEVPQKGSIACGYFVT